MYIFIYLNNQKNNFHLSFFLVRKGHQVEVFEGLDKAGGMTRFGIPEYRMPYDKLDRDRYEGRLRKLDEGEYDAIVLACAGLKRLGQADRITRSIDTGTMLP